MQEATTIKPTLLKEIMEEVMEEAASRLQMEIKTKALPPKPHHLSRAEALSHQEQYFLSHKRCLTLVND